MSSYHVSIAGLDCADCAAHLENDLCAINGVRHAKINFINKDLKLDLDESQTNFQQLQSVVEKSGYSLREIGQSRQSTLIVEGMDCADESRPIEAKLKTLSGIQDIGFNLLENKLILKHTVPLIEITNALKDIGFKAELAERVTVQDQSVWQQHKLLILTVISGIFALTGAILQFMDYGPFISVPLFIIAIISGGVYIFPKGFSEARNFRLGMNFLMTIAIIGAAWIGEWSEAAMVVFLFALAQLLESLSIRRARNSIKSLMELTPDIALLKTDNGSESMPVEEINIDDIIIIKPGARIPLDGFVTAGESRVNQAPITGESKHIKKQLNDEVFAGSINDNGTLEIKVSHEHSDSTISRIIHLVEEAQAQKAPTQNFVEKFARFYTPAVVSLAIVIAIFPPILFGMPFTEWLYRALVLLVISCPCALVISTPVTIVSGLTNAARNGILIKGGSFLENFGKLKVLAFDKTGTLTTGKPAVQKIIPLNEHTTVDLMQIAASLESSSEHPLADAILEYAKSNNIKLQPVTNFQAIPGKGISGQINGDRYLIGNHRLFEENNWCDQDIHQDLENIEQQQLTAVIVGNGKSLLGIIAIADAIRDQATAAITALHKSGIEKTVMLTGDNEITARAIATPLGIDEFRAGLLPQDKATEIQKLQQQHQFVAMIGDGINDAPALATANIGISMGHSGTDTALETADIALMKDDLLKLAFLKKLSRKSLRIIKENIFIALSLKAIFVILAIPGLATLWMAVFADMGASLIVVTNGLRALHLSRK